jgi:hypothetical protein
MIKLQRHAHSGFFPKIMNFAKSEFADFVIILEFDGFSSKTYKIQENTKTI